VVAAGLLLATSYVLGWRILFDGLKGSDSVFHLNLASWVQTTFPNIGWWYPWDGNGMPYREGYPLAAHWLTVLVSWASGWSLDQAMQVIQFAINPLCALGIYVFCAWRLGRPLAGLIAGFLYLLSPMTWTFLVDWGFYPNQVATVLFMPALIALDVCAAEWSAGGRGARLRVTATAFMALTALLAFVEPGLVAACLLAVPAYALAQGGRRAGARWLFVMTPVLGIGAVALCAFWAVPLEAWLGVVGSRQPAPVYSSGLFHLWTVSQVLELNPLQLTGFTDIYARTSLTPAVWLPAVLGIVYALWDRRARVFSLLVGFGLLTMTAHWLYALLYPVPLAGYLITFRAGMLYVQFLVPVLAGIGLVALAQAVVTWLLARAHAGRRQMLIGAPLIALAGLGLGVTAVVAFAHHVSDSPYRLAYGPYQPDERDLWKVHQDDICTVSSSSLCQSPTLTSNFSVIGLTAACVDKQGQLRTSIPICAALIDPAAPQWSSANDPLVASTLSWCDGSGGGDAVCAAQYRSLGDQLLDPRQPQVGCVLLDCVSTAAAADVGRVTFASPPPRAELDANTGSLFKAFHYYTGGGQVDSYNFQLVASPELNSWTKDSMLRPSAPGVKAQLSQAEGIDTVILTADQSALAGDYQAIGWQVTKPALPGTPTQAATQETLQSPSPTGLAEQRPGKPDVLVIGSLSDSPSNPYNTVFEHATQGMIPFAAGWIVKGRSAYVDDYTDQELASNQALLLLAYRYHDAKTAWDRLERYVRGGGRLYVETGWQYVDPDWSGGSGIAALPVTNLRWGPLDPSAPVMVGGTPDPAWGSLAVPGGAWGAASAPSVRSGAEDLVEVGGRIVVARWQLGSGRVLWSGMNLIAHQGSTGSADEATFLAQQWAWLLGGSSPVGTQISPRWQGDTAVLSLQPASGPSEVLFKESNAPGWGAELSWPGGSRQLSILDAEEDFMLVRLDSVPEGARVVFSYGPSPLVYAGWGTSGLVALVMLAWIFRPGPFEALGRRIRRFSAARVDQVRSAWEREEA
jgi:hypothetical protein